MSKEIGNTGITISTSGLLLKNGRTRIEPDVDPKTGYLCFDIPDYESPTRLSKAFVHVCVFVVHSDIPGIHRKDLGPEDVAFINGNRLATDYTNLKLTPTGLKKVYGNDGPPEKPQAPDPVTHENHQNSNVEIIIPTKSKGKPVADSNPASTESETIEEDPEEAPAPEPKPSTSAESPTDEIAHEAEEAVEEPESPPEPTPEQVSFTATKPNPKSNWYDVLDPQGNSVLESWNGGSKINGQANVEKLAEENGVAVEFID